MKAVYLFLLLSTVHTVISRASTITADQNGNWNTNSTWDLNRVPANNDIVVIPFGITVMLKNTPYSKNNLATRPTLRINIYGILDFSDPGTDKLYLDAGSVIQIFQNGKIQTSANSTEIIAIYNGTADNTVWSGSPANVSGPAFAMGATTGFSNGVLPVRLISFDIINNNNQTKLFWTTAEESAFSHFEIESYNASANEWKTLGQIKAFGESHVSEYTYPVITLKGINQFRLKMVDADGRFTYSPIRSIADNGANILSAWYDHQSKYIQVSGIDPQIKKWSVDVFDLNGVSRFHQEFHSSTQNVQLPSLIPGSYVFRVVANAGQSISKRIISF